MPTTRWLAYLASASTYLLIVLGGIVRITGSGMGCGDDWPLCNGRIVPPLDDVATLIEYGHRIAALGVSVLVVAVALLAVVRRDAPGVAGRLGTLRPALLAVALLVLQILLGAVTVILKLPASAVVLHLGTAMALLAVLMVVALRAGTGSQRESESPAQRRFDRGAMAALALGGAAVLLGGLTANLDAAGNCLGFPLCSGQVWPEAGTGGRTHIHWMHRVLAYVLTLHLIGMVVGMHRRGAQAGLLRATWIALGITLAQIAVGAAMILSVLQPTWRAAHVAAGTAVWVVLVALVWLSRTTAGAPEPERQIATSSVARETA